MNAQVQPPPEGWQAYFANRAREARSRMGSPLIAPPVVVKPLVIVRHRSPHLSDAEAAQNEAFYLSGLAMAAEDYCSRQQRARINTSEGYVRTTIREIIAEVCYLTGFKYIDIISHRRQAPLVLARQFAMWRAKNETKQSFPEIGRRFGNRDHTTCLWASKKIDRLISEGAIPKEWLATARIQGEPA